MQQKIILALRREPLRLSDIAKKTGRSNSGVSYQLQKMKKDGIIVCTSEKVYQLADNEEIERTILRILLKKTLPMAEILQVDELKSFEQDKVKALLNKLIITGLLEQVRGRSSEEGLHKVDDRYKLSFFGCRQLGVCYFCNDPVSEGIGIEGVLTEESWGTRVDYDLLLHPACVTKWMEIHWSEADYYIHGGFCHFCGLPTNANHLMEMIGSRNSIEFRQLTNYLSPEEHQAISSPPKPHDGWVEVGWEILYEEQEVENRSDIEKIVSKIAEKAAENNIELGEYNQHERSNQLWTIAEKLIDQSRSKWDILLKLCGPLLDPISMIYSQLPTSWTHDLKRYEISTNKDTSTGEEKEGVMPTKILEGAHAPIMVRGGKHYHLYCYRLALKFGMLKVGATQ